MNVAGECEAWIAGVKADTCATLFTALPPSDTWAAKWDGGVPAVQSPFEVLDLRRKEMGAPPGEELNCETFGFFCHGNDVWHRAVAGSFEVNLPLPTVTGTQPVSPECGFAGGCELRIDGSHLHTMVKNGLAQIEVCDRPCTFIQNPTNTAWVYPYGSFNIGVETNFVVCRAPPV